MINNPNLDQVSKEKAPVMFPGPYVAKVVSFVDADYMGGLQVQLLKTTTTGNPNFSAGSMYQARYLSPFSGQTPRNAVNKNDSYRDTQQAYGFWMIPPDIGTQVLIIFAEGNPNQCFWLGCVHDRYSNFAVPGNAATSFTTKTEPEKMQGAKLPVSEYNKETEPGTGQDPTRFLKPFQEDATNGLIEQGLIFDEFRGITSSSARREVPSAVFGFNTPGPIDKRAGGPKARVGTNESFVSVPKARLGGTSLVADDGDDKFLRRTSAKDGPPDYADVMQHELDGKKDIPHNELFRVRTRTGHQILLHNSEDLIYIANSRGTAWVELTSDGKIDIYAKDSISMHSENDFNFTANRNITIEAGANLYLKASGDHDATSKSAVGKIQMESSADTNILIGANGKITTETNFDLSTGGHNKFTAGTTTDISSVGNHTETAAIIHMNGPTAAEAAKVSALNTHVVPGVTLPVLTQRVPQHEPWPWHENLNPVAHRPFATDRDNNFTTKNDEPTPRLPDAFAKVSKTGE